MNDNKMKEQTAETLPVRLVTDNKHKRWVNQAIQMTCHIKLCTNSRACLVNLIISHSKRSALMADRHEVSH